MTSDEATWLSQVRQGWPEIIRQVERHDRKVAAIMQQVHPREVHYEHREVIGETTYDFHLKMVNRPESLVLVSDAISDLIGERFRFRCERMHT